MPTKWDALSSGVSTANMEIAFDLLSRCPLYDTRRELDALPPSHTTCLQPFRYDTLLEKHRPFCYTGLRSTLLPPDQTTHAFEIWVNTQQLPYCVYADIECLLEKGDQQRLEKHVPAAFAFLLVPQSGMANPPLPETYQVFVGPHCIEEGLQALDKLARDVYFWNLKNSHEKVMMTDKDRREHEAATNCYMCRCKLIAKNSLRQKVQEHDHLTGKYRGAACQECNDKLRLRRAYLPVFFHNLKNYDMHALCAEGIGKQKDWNLEVVATTEEKYMALKAQFVVNTYKDKHGILRKTYMTLRFLDSFQFLSASLDSLVRNLNASDLKLCQSLNLPSSDLITAKGVFPYSYFDSFQKLDETSLPHRSAFRSSITKEDITEEDYERAQTAWRLLNCQTFRDYMLIYLKRDVYQLADIFENFRQLSLREDGLDPAYYMTLPGLTWDSAFKMTGAKVDLLTDETRYKFVESGIRGGMTFVNEHHIVANTPRVPETFKPNEPLRDLLYVDANNLYGHALSQKLPHSEFRWITDEEIENLDLMSFNFDGDEGLILEVDLEYPPDVQDRTEDLPFAPEQVLVEEEMLTPLMKQQWSALMGKRYGDPTKPFKGYEKLLLTHYDREKYVVHGKLLQFYLQQGLVLRKVHRGLHFRQAAFFEPYISYNSTKRQQASNAFEKDYYKLKNNALFGKTMENVRRRINYRLCNRADKLTTLASRPEFLSSNIFCEDLVGVRLCKESIILNKPIFIGQAVLDLSKLEMYELRYIHLKRYEDTLQGEIRISGGDTDSFFLRVDRIPVDTLLLPHMRTDGLLDSSNYSPTHPLFSNDCKAKLGCIKDEAGGKPFIEWILLRPKAYSMQASHGKDVKRAKGVRRNTLQSEIQHEDYRRAFLEQMEFYHSQRRIGSQKHINYTLQYQKLTLTFLDDKRGWIEMNRSLPYGNHQMETQRRPPKRPATFAPELMDPEAKRAHNEL